MCIFFIGYEIKNFCNIEYKNKRAVIAADRKRYAFVNQIVKSVETRKTFAKNKNLSDKIDDILTNKWLGIPIFAVVMWLVFQISQVWVGAPVADLLVGLLEAFQSWVGTLLEDANPFLSALLVDGVIGGGKYHPITPRTVCVFSPVKVIVARTGFSEDLHEGAYCTITGFENHKLCCTRCNG